MRIARIGVVMAGVALAALGAVLPAASADTAPNTAGPQIIDGSQADALHGAARMFAGGQEICSATVIAPNWILTARHCTQGAGGQAISFHTGSLDQTQGTTVNATQVVESQEADISLVQIDTAVSGDFAPLGNVGNVNVGDQVQVYGWGATCTDRPEIECQSQMLKVANVSVNSIDCPDGAAGLSVCADRVDGITAGGDSGGPMYANGVQVGVASTSDRVSYTAYINVTLYRDWIASVAGV